MSRLPRRKRSRSVLVGIVLAVVLGGHAATRSAFAAHPAVTATWLTAQFVPSPQVVVTEGRSAFGLQWQLTPFLYSYGIHRSQIPIRTLVIEPIVRHSGSTELYVSPEYRAIGDNPAHRFGIRVGMRSYFPIVEKGEGLSLSLGTSYARFQGASASAIEGGAHALFGFVGLLTSYSPSPPSSWVVTLQIRVF